MLHQSEPDLGLFGLWLKMWCDLGIACIETSQAVQTASLEGLRNIRVALKDEDPQY